MSHYIHMMRRYVQLYAGHRKPSKLWVLLGILVLLRLSSISFARNTIALLTSDNKCVFFYEFANGMARIIQTNTLNSLGHLIADSSLCSKQQLVSCSSSFGNNGCSGGFYTNAWDYVKSVGGQVTAAAYPYTSSSGTVTN